MSKVRHDWRVSEIRAIHDLPLTELVYRARAVHREHFAENEVQLCSLLSVKTGGCTEDCGYCSQSIHHETPVKPEPLLSVDEVVAAATQAREEGATRFCMGAAWREVREGAAFDRVLEMVRQVRSLGLETCVTLGMLTDEQAGRLAEAGLTAYNHNLDTSAEHYGEVVTTRRFVDRLETLDAIRDAGIRACSGGILGLGESVDDRCAMLATLAARDPHPESIPVNALVAIEGTPMAGRPPVDTVAMARMIATSRIVCPGSMVRLSAGRQQMSEEGQLLCILAGANSIFFGERLLTTGNPGFEADKALLSKAGLIPLKPALESGSSDAA